MTNRPNTLRRGALSLLLSLALGFAPVQAWAEATDASGQPGATATEPSDNLLETQVGTSYVLHSGTCGTCSWTIDTSGALAIFPTDGASGQLDDSKGYSYGTPESETYFPWYQYRGSVRSASIAKGVALPSNANGLFRNFSSLTSLDLSGLDTSSATNMGSMFFGCSKLASLDVSGFDTSSATNMGYMFRGCSSLASLDVSGFDTSSATEMDEMFNGCSSLTSLNVAGWNTSHARLMGQMFHGCSKLTSLDVSGFDTSSVTYMSGMFYGCSSLTSLDVSRWNTSSAKEMASVFNGCSKLASLDVSNWDTSSARDMGFLFYGCSSLASLNVSGWDTSSVTDMQELFNGCSSLTSLDVSRWNTSSVMDMDCLFFGCSSLTSLDVASWNITSAVFMDSVFSGCSKLESIDLSGWGTMYVMSVDDMFEGCSSLATISVGKEFDTARAFPDNSERWWSEAEGKWFTTSEIQSSRNQVADTYRADHASYVNPFIDVTESTSHYDDILWLASSGISAGWDTPAGKEFRPNANVKRGDMAAFLFRLAKQWEVLGASDDWSPEPATRAKFADVNEKTAHAQAIWWMAQEGISAGWDVGGGRAEFRPNADVKRGDLAAFLGRLADKAGRKGSAKPDKKAFLDVTAKTSHCDEIWWMAASGVSGGWEVPGGKEFRPNASVKRGDMAAFLHRLDNVK